MGSWSVNWTKKICAFNKRWPKKPTIVPSRRPYLGRNCNRQVPLFNEEIKVLTKIDARLGASSKITNQTLWNLRQFKRKLKHNLRWKETRSLCKDCYIEINWRQNNWNRKRRSHCSTRIKQVQIKSTSYLEMKYIYSYFNSRFWKI